MRLRDIADKLDTSVSTVSRALNPSTSHLVTKRVRNEIQEYARQAKFIPNRTAQELVTGRTQTIGVILSSQMDGPFFKEHLSDVLSGIYQALETNLEFKCRLVILPKGKTLSTVETKDLELTVDGLLISSQCDHLAGELRDLPTTIRDWNRPVVILNLEPKSMSQASLVSFSNEEAAWMAVTHLIKKGRRKIGFIFGNMDNEDALDRFVGYKKALKDHRLPYIETYLAQGHHNTEKGYQATLDLLNKTNNELDGIFCGNDQMAFGCLNALKTVGIHCPKQISVIGFDGLHVGEYLDPPLTTVRQPTKEIARTGTQLLLDLIQGRAKGPVSKKIPCELIIREST